jgi:hypothetical protein
MTRTFRAQVGPLARQQAQDFHLKAAAHCEQAAHCHKEAALRISGGDFRAASSQSKLADEHTGYALLESQQAYRRARSPNAGRTLAQAGLRPALSENRTP